MLDIIKSNKKEWAGKGLLFKKGKDLIVINGGFFSSGAIEIPCSDVKEFKIIDEQSTAVKTKKAGGTVKGALIGGLLTGGIGAIVGAMAGGNEIKKDLKVKMGFKFKSGDWLVAQMKLDDQDGFVGYAGQKVLEALQTRFAVTEECPF
jgi:hypothetical protein